MSDETSSQSLSCWDPMQEILSQLWRRKICTKGIPLELRARLLVVFGRYDASTPGLGIPLASAADARGKDPSPRIVVR
jgi:hypothetical protein